MKVAECHTIRNVDTDTGEVTFRIEERWLEIAGVLTEDEAKERDRLQAIADANDAIRAQLREADIANLRALYEGDQVRIKAHAASQAELRKRLR